MPFSPEFDDVYTIIRECVQAVDNSLGVTRLDDIRAAGRITDDMIHHLNEAQLCIADVTGPSANVMWEVGYASALRTPIILLSQDTRDLPFDIMDLRAIQYSPQDLSADVKERLIEAIEQTLRRYAVATQPGARQQVHGKPQTVALTGSMSVTREQAEARLTRVLGPYLGRGFRWYVGSWGAVDEIALRLLLEKGEDELTVVGHTGFDISGTVLALLEDNLGRVEFMDASQEQLPVAPGAPSTRDLLFATRADTVILIWDGASQGTRALADWLTQQHKDHVLCFVRQ